MALVTRLARLVRADLNALLDRLEAPDLVLAQSIREMEEALDGERRTLARLVRGCERLDALEAATRDTLAQSEAALEDALAADRDDLARACIRRRLEGERRAAALKRRLAELSAERDALARRLAEREERLAELRARAALVTDAPGRPEGTDSFADAEDLRPAVPAAVRAEDIEIALLQAKRRRGAQG